MARIPWRRFTEGWQNWLAGHWDRPMTIGHRLIYRATGGRITGRVRGMPVLLLTTIGRKSGKGRTIPLTYLLDDLGLVLIASNFGKDRPPAWYLNLQHAPRVVIQVGRRRQEMIAVQATAEEKQVLWPRVVARLPLYEVYRRRTRREIPLLILHAAPRPSPTQGQK